MYRMRDIARKGSGSASAFTALFIDQYMGALAYTYAY